MAHFFHIPVSKAHLKWNKALPPALTVSSGSEVTFDLKDGGNSQVRPDNESTCLKTFDLSLADPAFGPVYVEGAEPGDVLRLKSSLSLPQTTAGQQFYLVSACLPMTSQNSTSKSGT